MAESQKLLILLIPLFPLVASLGTLFAGYALRASARGWLAVIGCASSSAACLTLLLHIARMRPSSAVTLELYRWLGDEFAFGLDVTVALHVDRLSAIMLTTITVVGTLVAIETALDRMDEPRSPGFFGALCFAVFAAAMLLLCPSFLQLFFFWQLAMVAVFLLIFVDTRTRRSTFGGRLFLLGLASEVPLLIGICIVWANFGTLEIAAVLADEDKLALLARSEPATLTTLCLCLLAPVVVRCAQFPAFGWLHDASEASGPVSRLLQSAVLMPVAMYLPLRCYSFFAASADARLLTAFVGGVTALLAAVIAAVDKDARRTLSYTTSAFFGVMLVGVGTGAPLALAAVLLFLAGHCLAKAPLFTLCADTALATLPLKRPGPNRATLPLQRAIFVAATIVLTSGMWGQDAVLSAAWDAARRPAAGRKQIRQQEQQQAETAAAISVESRGDRATIRMFGAGPERVFLAMFCAAVLSLLLTSFALFGIFFRNIYRPAEPMPGDLQMPDGPRQWSLLPAVAAVVAAVAVGLLFGWQLPKVAAFFNLVPSANLGSAKQPFISTGLGAVTMSLGAVGAWMLSARSATRAERGERTFTCVAERRFYLDEIVRRAFVGPLLLCARLARLLDGVLVDALLVRLPARIPLLAARTARPLQNGLVQFYALSVLLSAAVFLAAILWLRG